MSEKIILAFVRQPAGGTASYINNYILNAREQKNIHYKVIYFQTESNTYFQESSPLGIDIEILPKISKYNLIKKILCIYKFFKKNKDIFVIEVHNANVGFIFLLPAWLKGIKRRIVMLHSSRYSEYRHRVLINKVLTKITLLFSTSLIACSKLAGDKIYGKKKFEIFKGGASSENYRFNISDRINIREKFNIPSDSTVICHIGRLSPVKNHFFILEVFELFIKKQPQARLILIGDGPLKEEIKSYIAKKALSEFIIMIEHTSKPYLYLSASDIFILPSLFEGLPISAIEAQLSGLQCIISDKVSEEIKFNENISFLKIEDNKLEWVEKITEYSKIENDRTFDLKNFNDKGLNIKEEALKRISYYLSLK